MCKQRLRNRSCESCSSLSAQPFLIAPRRSTDDRLSSRIGRQGVSKVSENWLYNRLQSPSGCVVMDLRDEQSFAISHIERSINVTHTLVPGDLDKVARSIELKQNRESFEKRRLMEIILVDADGESAEGSWPHRLASMLLLEGSVSSIKYLIKGFSRFQQIYPFMIEFEWSGRRPRTSSGLHVVSYPNEILDNFLYLGNMWQASQKDVIHALGITHIVNASLDVGNVFGEVKYLSVQLKDKKTSDIQAHFQRVKEFIDDARKCNGKVLIHCTQGISRSATLTIYYCMAARKSSLVTAYNHVLSRRAVIYPNVGFMEQLIEAEKRIYKGNSLDIKDIDHLMAGHIADHEPNLFTNTRRNSCKLCKPDRSKFSFAKKLLKVFRLFPNGSQVSTVT